jgi:hypothetical protein
VSQQISLKFLRSYLLTLILLLGGTIAFNLIIDPFGINYIVEIDGINNVKTGQGNHVRMGKAGTVRALRPRSVILGNSRAEYGINPEHPGWKAGPVYNLAISGANFYEILRYFQHAHGIQPLEQALFILDLNQFNAYWENANDFSENRLSVTFDEQDNAYYYLSDFIATTLSLKALSQSVNTIWRSATNKSTTYLANGQRDWRDDRLFRTAIEKYGSYSDLFSVEERGLFSARSRNHAPLYLESPLNQNSKINVFDWFRHLVQIAIRDKIDLRLAIGPSHARYFESHRLMGNWFLWEEWKRNLALIVEEEAAKAGVTPFPLWDFSGFNPLTMEPVPPADDKKTRMKWYFESSHYTTDLGDMIQDRVFDHKESGRTVPDYFGVLITSKNIMNHLDNIREENIRFRESQPKVAKELSDLAAEFDLLDSYAKDANGNNITFKW